MIRIGFIGHSYNLLTGSTDFLLTLLRRMGDVSVHWSSNKPSLASLRPSWAENAKLDCIVVVQVDQILPAISAQYKNVIFAPMLDQTGLTGSFTLPVGSSKDIKLLCFSSTLFEKLRLLKHPVKYLQFYPDPEDLPQVTDYSLLRGYFWKRQNRLDEKLISTLCSDSSFDSFTLHAAPDPGTHHCYFLPSQLNTSFLRRTQWYSDKRDYLTDLCSHNVFFAPRYCEGIGMAFLEAMAMGLCVVAPNTPTHNEYIQDGITGLLYDFDRPKPIDLSDYSRIGREARNASLGGHRKWVADCGLLSSFILDE